MLFQTYHASAMNSCLHLFILIALCLLDVFHNTWRFLQMNFPIILFFAFENIFLMQWYNMCYNLDDNSAPVSLQPQENKQWWRNQMETFPRYWPFVRGIHRWFPSQRTVPRSFGVFFALRLNKRLRKQSRRRWFETPSRLSWRNYNV